MISNPSIDNTTLNACEILWSFNCIEVLIDSPDVIILLGSNDLSVANVANALAQRYPNLSVLCSGGTAHVADLLATGWNEPEGAVFARRLAELGVNRQRLLVESKALNTAENIRFARELLGTRQIIVKSAYLVQKPFMCLRALLTARKEWPGIEFGVRHRKVGFGAYFAEVANTSLIDILVGDTERVMRYPELGYFDPIPIPPAVDDAFALLVSKGYTRHCIQRDTTRKGGF
jgi:hypothetical protein